MKFNGKVVLWLLIAVLLVGGIAAFAMSAEQKTVVPENATLEQAREFEEFYKDKVPGKYAMWKESAHGKNGVTCINCHGTEPLKEKDLKLANFGIVKPETCGECHQKEYEGFKETRHVKAVEFSKKNVRYHLLDGFPAMQQQGCDSCHTKVAETCTSCHQGHTTASPMPKNSPHQSAEVTGNFTNGCENCHMGPDHPQREAYESSVHYQVAQATGQPTCITCHTDPDNNHEIIAIRENPEKGWQRIRENCLKCHTAEYVDDAWAQVQEVIAETNRIVDEARKIIKGLYEDGILKPSPGSLLDENGLPMLNAKGTSYSHVSAIENKMFELFKYAQATTIKGAKHFAPDYAHWHGLADLWTKYLEIKEEAERLRLEHKLKQATGVEEEEYPMYQYRKATGNELEQLK